jgi:hypothetical protein
VPITDEWFEDAPTIMVYGSEVRITKPTELIWSKAFLQDRYRYDGADVAHVILKKADEIDWKRLLRYMEAFWEVLLIHLLNFRLSTRPSATWCRAGYGGADGPAAGAISSCPRPR